MLRYDSLKAKNLRKEIDNFLTIRRKENAKLAKEIAKWVDTAMTNANSGKSSASAAAVPNEDVDILEDCESDEEWEPKGLRK